MKRLFDENLSPKLASMLAVEYPQSVHVRDAGLKGHNDDEVWTFAREQGFAIVSKDTDFRERSFVEGFPPKILWLDVGNSGTVEVANLLRRELRRVEAFAGEEESSMLILSIARKAI